ncbi:ATP-binding cassette domain-containing protein [Cellulomonas sp. P24]|uniref:ATP-binding cassette domain-containing protein n=1 Tax=Cellulomonas sp. P24 TaxID=2885206 RepID=UPI00216B2562|nr:ATP-binding cassette domain-containing protein [Cellulomonas sp. P24]MCR6492494.1 ATP-binding cassette domain-containing protein [Cellulomonas sp. P24]
MIALHGVTKRFGEQVVLDAVDLELTDGGMTALMGSNGSGKTTLGRLLLGLETADEGAITELDGRRRAAVFQEDRLCEQLTAVGNVRLVLDRGTPVAAVVDELRHVGLDDESLAKPVRELSGGQRRRVAIVRALMPEADLVVLDEPFTSLDTDAKVVVTAYVRDRCRGRTTLLITHDRADADGFGARVVELGRAATA